MADQNAISVEDYEDNLPLAVIDAEAGKLGFFVPSRMAAFRVQSMFTKEPETMAWIAGFEAGSVLVDIGANMGIYTIWAAKHRNAQVIALEPEAQNFGLLNRNIHFNDLDGQVTAYCAAASDENAFSVLNLGNLQIGGSMNKLGEELDQNLEPREALFRQGCVSVTLDHMRDQNIIPDPHHIKIDVDGLEHKVIAGAREILAGTSLRSVLVEINPNLDAHMALFDQFADLGYSVDPETKENWRAGRSGNCIFSR